MLPCLGPRAVRHRYDRRCRRRALSRPPLSRDYPRHVLARALTPFRLLAAAALVLVAAAAFFVVHRTDEYLEIPDEAHPLAGLVSVSGGKTQQDGGGIYYVDVLVKRATLLESVVPAVRPEG